MTKQPPAGCASGAQGQGGHAKDMAITALASSYCVWLLYAAGLKYLLLSAMLYAPGAVLFALAKRQRGQPLFTPVEWAVLAVISGFALVAVWMLWHGSLGL